MVQTPVSSVKAVRILSYRCGFPIFSCSLVEMKKDGLPGPSIIFTYVSIPFGAVPVPIDTGSTLSAHARNGGRMLEEAFSDQWSMA